MVTWRLWLMDKEKILTKLGELDGYVSELKGIIPKNFSAYKSTEIKRACERLLQISLEAVLDVCNILVSELKLGIPENEDAVLEKLKKSKVISESLHKKLVKMKRTRNVLVHRYGITDDKLIFGILERDIKDFKEFRKR